MQSSLIRICSLLCSLSVIISARLMEGSLNGVVLNGRGGLGRLQRHLEGRDNVSYYPNGDPYWLYRSNPNPWNSWNQQQYQNNYQYQNQYYQSQYQYPQYRNQYAYPQYQQRQQYYSYPQYKSVYYSNSYATPYGYYPKRA